MFTFPRGRRIVMLFPPGGFSANKPFIENEYRDAKWDPETGLAPKELLAALENHFHESEEKGVPYPIALAEGFALTLRSGRLDLNEHTPFPDKINHGQGYRICAWGGVFERLSCRHYDKVLDEAVPCVRKLREITTLTGLAIPDTDVWHTVLDWEAVLQLGFPGLLSRVRAAREAKRADGTSDERAEVFYRSAEIELEGVLAYLNRIADGCAAQGRKEAEEAYRALTVRAPETLYEALCCQHVALTVGELGHERIRSYGHFDRNLTPFYERDLAAGRLTREEVQELLRYFLQKTAAELRYADQPICLGRDYREGTAAAELTDLLLDEYQALHIHSPKLHIRIRKDTPESFVRRLMRMTRDGSSSIVLISDETIYAAYARIGISREAAEPYLPIGCYESVIPGLEETHICSSWINLSKAVEYTLTGGEDLLQEISLFGQTPEPESWEEFLRTFYTYLHRFSVYTMDSIRKQEPHCYAANPSPFLSATMESCVARGRDIFDRGLPLGNENVKVFAIGTTVDSLLAVKHFIYEKKRVTVKELVRILKNDWKGADALRSEIRADPAKWGNGIAEADELARDIYSFMGREIIGKPTANNGVFRMGGDSVDMAERYGKYTGASADGRHAHEMLSKNMRPVIGCERSGIAGFLKSVGTVDGTLMVDGAPLDFMLHPTACEGEAGLDMMCAMIRVFFENHGVCIHGTVVDTETLLDAREHPEKYPDLQVRVCGWNEYFVLMNPELQSDFIRRASGGTRS